MNLTYSSSLSLVDIEFYKDKKNYILEDKKSNEFYEMPEICINAIQLIQQKVPLADIEKQLQEKHPDEEVNLIDFAEQLLALNLVDEVDGEKIENRHKQKESYGFLWISPKVGKLFFHPLALIAYLFLFFADIYLLQAHPDLFPNYRHIFMFKYMFLNIPALLVLSAILVLIHEFGHIFAIRAHNFSASVDVGHRLFLVVVETDLSSAWKLPPKERNVLYLAGLCFDTVILFLAFTGQLLLGEGPGIFLSLLQAAALVTILRMAYQCCIYMKTDLYYVFENITGCYNLAESAQQFIRKHLFFRQHPGQDELIFPEEKNIVALYSCFYFIGVFLTIFLYIVFYIPQLVFSFKKVIPGLGTSPAGFTFWDSALFILQLLLGLLLLLSSWKKKYLHS